jgi:hypothetical protein
MGANVAGGQSGHGLSGAQILAKLLALGALGFAIPDNVFNIVGSSDATKVARFEVDGLTTATTRVYTLPDASITVAGVNLAQTFSATQTFAGIDATSIGATTRGTGLFTTIGANGQITSTVSTGTAPFVVASTTVVANLNASQLLGNTWSAPGAIGGGTPGSAAHTTISASGQITSTVSTGTAPFVVASTTVVGNLNVSQLLGSTWAAPGTIGSGTPSTGAFTSLTTSVTGAGSLVVAGSATIGVGNGGSLTLGGSLNLDRGGVATLMVGKNGTNPNCTILAGPSGPSYFASNVLITGGVDVYGVATFPSCRFGNGNGTTTRCFEVEVAAAGTAGSAITWISALTCTNTGSVSVGPIGALATNATDGFLYMPTCAGTPSGTPTAISGKVAHIYDTTNNKLYVYNGAWKATAALT